MAINVQKARENHLERLLLFNQQQQQQKTFCAAKNWIAFFCDFGIATTASSKIFYITFHGLLKIASNFKYHCYHQKTQTRGVLKFQIAMLLMSKKSSSIST